MPDTWVTPRIWTAGERVGQSKMNEISTDLRALYPYTTVGDLAIRSAAGNYLERVAHGGVANKTLRSTSQSMAWGGYIGAKAIRTTNQSVNNITATNVQFGTAEILQGVTWSGGDNTKLTIVTAGLYLIGANYSIDGGAGYRQANILKNGSILIESRHDNAAGETTNIILMGVEVLAAADYLQLSIMHNNGSAINLRNADFYAVFIGV